MIYSEVLHIYVFCQSPGGTAGGAGGAGGGRGVLRAKLLTECLGQSPFGYGS